MNYDDKKFMTLMKAIFYQLFSRKMQYVVFSGKASTRDTFLFSNVDADTMMVYDDNPKYCFHKVVIKDKKFLDDFYARFPILLTSPAFIRVVDFLSPLSKLKDLQDVKMITTDCFLSILCKGTDPVTKEPTTDVKDIGILFSVIEYAMYTSVFEHGIINSEDPYHHALTGDAYVDTDPLVVAMQDIAHPTDKFKAQHALVMLQPGFNIPTLHAFCKSISGPDTIDVVVGYDKNCLIVNYEYTSDLLTSYGVQPAQRWFAKDVRT